MKKLKIGFIGAGGIVRQRHLPGLRALPELEITAVANSTEASARRFCQENHLDARVVAQWQELAALPDLDIVWIGATPYLHEAATVAALQAGKHVFCQARMARTLAEAEWMLAKAESHADQVTMLCPPPHGLNGDAWFKKLLADAIAGEITGVELKSLNKSFLDPALPLHWRQDREISGNNILTLGIHTEVIQRWLGDFTVESARGKIATPVRAGRKVDIPDELHVQILFPSGATGTLEFSGIHRGEPTDVLSIEGTKGTLVYDYTKDEIRFRPKDSPDWQPLPIPAELARGWRVEEDFINAVRDPQAPRPHPDFNDGVRYMQVVDAVANNLRLQ